MKDMDFHLSRDRVCLPDRVAKDVRETGMFSDEKVKCFYSVAFMPPHSHPMNYEALRAAGYHQVTMFNRKGNMQR